MTIQADFYAIADNANGSTKIFSLPWPFRAQSDVVVQLTDASGNPIAPPPVLNGGGTYDFVIIGTADPDTGFYPSGNVQFNNAPPAPYVVYRSRATKDWQDKSFPTNGRLPAKSVEAALDRRTLVDQEQDYLFGHLGGTGGGGGPSNGRIVMMSAYDLSTFSPILPPTAGSAGFVLAQKADGSGFQWVDLSNAGKVVTQINGTPNQITVSAPAVGTGIVTISLPRDVNTTSSVGGFGPSFSAKSTSTTGVPALYVQNDANNISVLQMPGSGTAPSAASRPGATVLYGDGPGGMIFSVNAPQPISFSIQGAEVARFEANGNLGIGMAPNSGAPIDIRRTTNGMAQVEIQNMSNGASAISQFHALNDVSRGIAVYMLSSGFATDPINFANGAVIWADAPGGLSIGTGQPGPIRFYYNATEIVRMGQPNGYGMSIAPAPLGGASGGACLALQLAGTNNWVGLQFHSLAGGAYAMDIQVDVPGSSYIALFRNSGTGMVGAITHNGTNTTYGTSSDLRLKENVKRAATDAGNIIDAIEVEEWDWLFDGSHQPHGIVAQKLHKIYPLAVTPGVDGEDKWHTVPWMIDYSKLVPLLVAEVQSLRRRLDKLTKEKPQ